MGLKDIILDEIIKVATNPAKELDQLGSQEDRNEAETDEMMDEYQEEQAGILEDEYPPEDQTSADRIIEESELDDIQGEEE